MKKMIFDTIRNGLIVSCQAEGTDPFNTPGSVAKFAQAAVMGGAIAIRSEGLKKIERIKQVVKLPIIGLLKSQFDDGFVRITGSFKEVEQLLGLDCDIVAIDGTFRKRESLSGPEFIHQIKNRYNCIVMADIASVEEAMSCVEAGADCISTTLNGYTPETSSKGINISNFELVQNLVKKISIPIIAEGKIDSPVCAKQMLAYGAWAVVVGTAITRPKVVTQWYVNELNQFINGEEN